jgi:FAS-associated factor 2
VQTFWSLSNSLYSIFTYPFHVFAGIVRYIFGSLRIPIPHIHFSSLNFHRLRGGIGDSRGGIERWVRCLEEETGAICISRARSSQSAASSSAEIGPSSRSTILNISEEQSQKLLPDFSLENYENFLRRCQKEARIACVILISEEHDDVAEFKRQVRLT